MRYRAQLTTLITLLFATIFTIHVSARTPRIQWQSRATNLGGTSWQLVKFQSSDGTTITPDDGSKYTISFGINERVNVRIDCNSGSGTWRSTGRNRLRFGSLALTRVACPPGSLHDRIVRDWRAVRSYEIKDGRLFLYLVADRGVYEYEPIGGSASSLFGKRWRLTEVRGSAVRTTRPFLEFDSNTRRVSGDGGCNRFSGSFSVDGMNIRISQVVSTRRACIDRAMQRVETNFLAALEEVTEFQIQGNVLRLNAAGSTILTFRSNAIRPPRRF